MKGNKSQNQMILEHLMSGKSITPMDALTKFGCFRLSARISDIRGMGYPIHTELVNDKKPDGRYERYARYMLIEIQEVH